MDASGHPLDAAFQAIASGTHDDPFAVLGPHSSSGGGVVRAFLPQAQRAFVVTEGGREVMTRVHPDGLWEGPRGEGDYRLGGEVAGHEWTQDDPYRFGPLLGELDCYLLAEGRHQRAYEVMGAHPTEHEGTAGVRFAVWAPGARRVSVVGHFCEWDGRRLPMRRRSEVGVWE